ncbi:Crp/Fnr family transcriptional regulator [Luteimonas wenzhouensis]|jgi:CRP/FNR family transcriptional regulator|uniref:CRP-like protein Clp n=1 Tax=Luteimonas wenzhouensis TaxID=2599615 RepID=A0A5C5U792_9GAMM|nr:helix-turn-helix domain-containing protein [Luteimonas wenzhouensis]NLW97737.1 helix-turn-helix domain-containing protein [Xanthomonadaceae bacterium]TWT21609.1 cyclic nucleotide-binding domain-containing protein [Luteimonas wenzhouensis]
MSSQPLPRCRQHARTVVPLDCARCAVRDLAVCSSLPSPEADALERLVSSIELQPNGELARAGQPCRHAYSVTAGMLRVVRTLADARRQVVAFVTPGHFVGLSGHQVHRYAIEAVTASRVCVFGIEGIDELRRRFPSFEHTLLERACRDLDDAHDSMLLLARLSPLERLASFLVRLRQQLRIRADDPCVALPMGRGDIADHLGLTVETVSRSFTRLREQGVIALPDPHRVEILDHAALEGLASALH